VLDKIKARVDAFLQRPGPIGFLWGVWKKFGDDRAGQQAALVAYYGFFALFPLMLVLVTVLGIVLRNNPQLQDDVLSSALAQFPIIGDQIRENIHSLSRSGIALVIGIGGALWAGLGGIKAMQNAMDQVWGVPRRAQPGVITQLVRGLLMLLVLGAFTLVATGLAGVTTSGESVPVYVRAFTFPLSLAVNVLVFLLAFRILTVAEVRWGDVLPGAVVAGFAWAGLQAVGNYYVGTQLKNASALYGFFGVVIGLLSWLYLASQTTLLAAEINVVRKFRLWPRSIGPDPVTDADRRALERYAKVEERSDSEKIEVRFPPRPEGRRRAS
jgi:YihY family inner membrane protein